MLVRARSVLALVCVAAFLVYLDTSIVPVAIPAIDADLPAGETAAQWLLDSYTLTFACLLLTAGSLGDRLGRKPVLLAGVAGFTLASAACALAPSMSVLIGARAAQGVFAAAVVPLSLAVTSALYADPAGRARAIGIWGGACGAALAAGPLLGGVLVQTLGWRSLFWINVPIGLVAFAGVLATMPDERPTGGRRADPVGQATFVLGAAGVTFALVEGPTAGWLTASILVTGLGGLGLLLAFAGWERRAPEPMLPPALLRIPAVVVACTVNFLGLFGLYAALLLVTLHLQNEVGLDPLQTGLRFLTLFGALGIAAVLAAPVAARLGTRRTMLTGLLCVAAGLFGLCLLDRGVGYPGYAWALLLLGIGVPLSSGVVAIQAMMGRVPAAASGTASGAMNTFRQFGAVLGVALAGVLSPVRDGRVTSLSTTFLVAGAGALAAAVLVLALLPARRPEAAPVPARAEGVTAGS